MASAGNNKIASRYAKAIIEAFLKGSESAPKVKQITDELASFAGILESNHELTLALQTDLFSEDERIAIVGDLVNKLGLGSEAKRVLMVILESKRLKALPAIAEKLHQLLLDSAHIVPMQVLTAGELSGDERKKVEARFAKIFGKDVEASYSVQPSLIGGLRVTAVGKTYDGSLSGWLETIEEKLVGGSI